MEEAPYYVWRRGDGYVGCTRSAPRSGKSSWDQFTILLTTDDWGEAKALIEQERGKVKTRVPAKADDRLTIYQCSVCGFIEGEEPWSCCRKCGTKDEPTAITVEVR